MTRTHDILPQWREALSQAGLQKIEDVLDIEPPAPSLRGRVELLGKPGLGGRQRWRWVLENEAADRVLYVKRYDRTPLRDQVDRMRRQAARHSRAWWEFHEAGRLAEAHIPVPRPVGFAEEMQGAFEHRSAVVFERASGDAFDRVWSRATDRGDPITRGWLRHDVTVRLARLVAAFHQTGCCHRDLYLCHVFVDLDPQAARPPVFCLIDLARTHRPKLRRMRWLLKDLSQLDCSARQIGATRSDRWRFLLAYLGLQRGAPRARWYVRRIERKRIADR